MVEAISATTAGLCQRPTCEEEQNGAYQERHQERPADVTRVNLPALEIEARAARNTIAPDRKPRAGRIHAGNNRSEPI